MSWQIRTILITMAGYALFYFVRKNFSLAMPGLTAEYGISNTNFGWIIFAGSLVYGLSRFINGYVVDRIKGRIVMALGLLLCAAANFAFGFGTEFSAWITGVENGPKLVETLVWVMGVVIILNQYFQGMGYPPCARILPHWIHPSELATKMSVWNCSHSIGAALAVIVCGYLMGSLGTNLSADAAVVGRITANLADNGVANAAVQALEYAGHVGAWKWCFWIPACMAAAGAVMVFAGLRDEPRDVKLPDLPDTGLGAYSEQMGKKARRRFEAVMVWRNRWVWTFCIANLFVYVVRMGVLDWGPKFLTENRGLSIQDAGWTVAAFEIAGILGTLFAGWATDHLFKGKGHRMCVICMLGAALFMTIFPLPAPDGRTHRHGPRARRRRVLHLRSPGTHRHRAGQPGHQGGLGPRQRHRRHPGLHRFGPLGTARRLRCRRLRLDPGLRNDHRHRRHRHVHPDLHVVRAARRIRAGLEDRLR